MRDGKRKCSQGNMTLILQCIIKIASLFPVLNMKFNNFFHVFYHFFICFTLCVASLKLSALSKIAIVVFFNNDRKCQILISCISHKRIIPHRCRKHYRKFKLWRGTGESKNFMVPVSALQQLRRQLPPSLSPPLLDCQQYRWRCR